MTDKQLTSFSILIADDNEINRWLLAEQMQEWTTDITQCQDGLEASQLLQSKSYDMIFLDVNMPFFNGFDLIKQIRDEGALNRLTPVVAVTAHAYASQRQGILAAGFNECLVKPILLKHLQVLINQWLVDSSHSEADYYARAVLDKTDSNPSLGVILLEKLFDELPDQLRSIEDALQNQQQQQAWDIAHKIHGAFCFYGFADLKPIAERLEQSLLSNDAVAAELELKLLNNSCETLLNNKASVIAKVSAG